MNDTPDRDPTKCPREGPQRRRDKEATRQALLDAAVQIFADRGYEASTTRDIAQTAGVNEQLIQRYFGGKRGLLFALMDRFDEEERQCCGLPPAPDTSVEAEIEGFLNHQLKHAHAVRNLSKVALERAVCDPQMGSAMGKQFAANRVPLLQQRLEALRERGLIDAGADLEAAATALSSLSLGLAVVDQLIFGADCKRLQRVAKQVARVYAAGLAPGAVPEAQ